MVVVLLCIYYLSELSFFPSYFYICKLHVHVVCYIHMYIRVFHVYTCQGDIEFEVTGRAVPRPSQHVHVHVHNSIHIILLLSPFSRLFLLSLFPFLSLMLVCYTHIFQECTYLCTLVHVYMVYVYIPHTVSPEGTWWRPLSGGVSWVWDIPCCPDWEHGHPDWQEPLDAAEGCAKAHQPASSLHHCCKTQILYIEWQGRIYCHCVHVLTGHSCYCI